MVDEAGGGDVCCGRRFVAWSSWLLGHRRGDGGDTDASDRSIIAVIDAAADDAEGSNRGARVTCYDRGSSGLIGDRSGSTKAFAGS
jgi:hypothetical protein